MGASTKNGQFVHKDNWRRDSSYVTRMTRCCLNNNKHRVLMQIVQITPRFTPSIGGLERHVYEISKEFAKRGHRVTILTTNRIDGGIVKTGRSLCSDFSVYRCAVDLKVKNYEVSLSMLKKISLLKQIFFTPTATAAFPSTSPFFRQRCEEYPSSSRHTFFTRLAIELLRFSRKPITSLLGD